MRYLLVILLSCSTLSALNILERAQSKILRWRLAKGDLLEVEKTAKQNIKVGESLQKRYVIHRVLLSVDEADAEKGYGVNGVFHTKFKKSKTSSEPFQAEESHTSQFHIQPLGTFQVPDGMYMPNIRNVPTFDQFRDPVFSEAAKILKKGDTWQADAEEYFQTDLMIKIPLKVSYEYRGAKSFDTAKGIKTLHKVKLNYQLNYEARRTSLASVPKRIFGFVSGWYLWDEEEGIPYMAKEDYNVLIVYGNGITHEFDIKSKSKYRKIKKITKKSKSKLKKKLDTELRTGPVEGISIHEGNQGITIRLADILFSFNSSDLSSKSRDALDQIANILKQYPEIQIEVRGYTDNIGTQTHNLELSEQRAKNVVNYLIQTATMKDKNLSYRGFGSKNPVASNVIAAGRKKNRRVEIVILDK